MSQTTSRGPSHQSGPPAGAAPAAFSRAASGLVRDLSIWDAMWFGVLSSGLFFSFVYFFPYPQYVTPGISAPLMLLIATVATIPIAICYAGLGSAMPRAGGDYLFQSRGIAPWIGFVVPFGWAILLWTIFYPLCTSVFVASGLAPILDGFGDSLGWSFLHDVSTWLQTEAGAFVGTLVLSFGAYALTVAGVGAYRKFQRRVFVPAIVITFLTFVIALLFTSTTGFKESFDTFAANKAAGVTVDGVFAKAREGGWSPAGFSFGDTILWVPIMMGVVPFAVFASEGMLGEVKGARNFKKMAGVFLLGATIIGVVVLGFVYLLFERTVSRDFISAASFVTNTGAMELPTGLNLSALTSTISSSPFLALALGLGFMASAFQLLVGIYMNVTRVLVSMGLDRSLPSEIAKVDERTHTPVRAATIYLAVLIVTSAFFTFNPDWFTPLLSTAAISGLGILLFGCLAAFLLPFRNPQVYAASPIAKVKVLGLPLLQVAGAVGFLIQLASWITIMTNDKLGVTGAGLGLKFDPRFVVIVPTVVAAAIFFGWRRIERGRGVDPALAFKQVPPE